MPELGHSQILRELPPLCVQTPTPMLHSSHSCSWWLCKSVLRKPPTSIAGIFPRRQGFLSNLLPVNILSHTSCFQAPSKCLWLPMSLSFTHLLKANKFSSLLYLSTWALHCGLEVEVQERISSSLPLYPESCKYFFSDIHYIQIL